MPKIGFDVTNVTSPSTGQMVWNQEDKTIDVGINGVVLQLGQELMTMVRNSTGTTITQGTACMGVGTIGASGRILVATANMSTTSNAFRVLGIATEDIAPGVDGFVTYFGKVRTLNTSAWNEGDVLYLSNTTPGALTNVEPTMGVKQTIARVINKHATVGTLMVRTLPLDENSYNAASVLTKIKTVDGTGSGLDADLLDGQEGSYYATAASVTAAASTQTITDTIMSKSAFNAIASERRVNRAGSGFDEFGKHRTLIAGYSVVNDGISLSSSAVNSLSIGWADANKNGASLTDYPKTNINGINHVLNYINTAGVNYSAKVELPTAPTIYPYDATLTTEQIASGVIKHADSSNSGLIVNGKFDVDTSGWSNVSTGTGTFTYSSGKVSIVGTNSSNQGSFRQTMSLVIGKTYTLECEVASLSGSVSIGGTAVGVGGATAISGRNVFSFVATQGAIYFYTQSGGGSCTIDNIAVYPADAISRSDLVFLESWHEDVSEKDFVYPLGNVQYLGGATDGLSTPTNGAFSGFETYSLFGKWQASSSLIGKGYVWSALTDAQKKAFVSNPDNNMYLDGATYVQVRYRVRVIQGWGDSWVAPYINGAVRFAYDATNGRVKPKGKQALIQNDIAHYSADRIVWYVTADHPDAKADLQTNIGIFQSTLGTTTPDTIASYEGKCYALPIVLIHRRNQGGYNATYNANGTKAMTMTPLNISDCFNIANLTTATGYIGTSTPRGDGLFYDQVSVEDFKPTNKGADLRNSSKKRTAQSIIKEFAPKALASTIPFYNNDTTPLTTYKDFMEVRDTSGNRYAMKSKIGNVVNIVDTVANKKGFSVVTSNGKQFLQVADDATSDTTVQMNLSTIKYDIGVFDA